MSTPTQHSLCAALSSDGNYYRGTIRAINNDDTVLIHYIDYGNCEIIPRANLKELDPKHRHLSALATRAYLAIESVSPEAAGQVKSEIVAMTDGFQLITNVMDIHQSNCIVDITNSGRSLSQVLQDKGLITAITLDQVKSQIDADRVQMETYTMAQVSNAAADVQQDGTVPAAQSLIAQTVTASAPAGPPADAIAAYISHSDQPDRFYLQLDSISDELYNFQQSLQIIAPSLPPLTIFCAGELCIAHYSVDEQWYRARIIDTDGEITSIQFIDYGNTDTITDNTLLKLSNESLQVFEPFAMPCALAVKPRDQPEWREAACQKLQDVAANLLHLEYISKGPIRNYVNLYHGERNLAKELIDEELATRIDIIRSGEKCFVSHGNSISDFYIQMDVDSPGLQLVEDYLSDASRFEPLNSVSMDSICIAQFEDGNFYRARVRSERNPVSGQIEVFFVDYGNTFAATDVRSLPQNIAELPHLTKHCSLHLPNSIQAWSAEAELKFKELCGEGLTIFTVRLVKPGDTSTIELFIDERNISDELVELCTPRPLLEQSMYEPVTAGSVDIQVPLSTRALAYVSHYNSPQSIYIQLDVETEHLDEMVACLNGAAEFPPVDLNDAVIGDFYAALFTDDQCYYRCQALGKSGSGYRVLFIDYGNEAVTEVLRRLPEILQTAEPLSIHCQLEPVVWTDDQLKIFHNLVSDQETTFQIEEVDNLSSPRVIRMHKSDVNILNLVGIGTQNAPLEAIAERDTTHEDSTLDSDITNKENQEIATEILCNLIEQVHCGEENREIVGDILNDSVKKAVENDEADVSGELWKHFEDKVTVETAQNAG